MHYLLAKSSELTEILPLRCSYMDNLDLQIAIHGIGLKSLNSEQEHFLNYDSLKTPDTERLICHFISEIDFASLHMVLTHPLLKTRIQPDLLLQQYQIPASPHVYKILERSMSWAFPILNWLVQRKIKPHELAFLNLLNETECDSLLQKASRSSLSKMDSLKLLETASELILMKIDIDPLTNADWNDKTLSELLLLRYPMSFTKNPINQMTLKWPKTVSTQAKRIQDKMGIQIQFFVSHPEELNQTLSQLENIVPEWTSKLERLNL